MSECINDQHQDEIDDYGCCDTCGRWADRDAAIDYLTGKSDIPVTSWQWAGYSESTGRRVYEATYDGGYAAIAHEYPNGFEVLFKTGINVPSDKALISSFKAEYNF